MASSIWDVAKRAGISKSTVSRVMNGGSASEKTRAAVLDAIEELQYYPNGMARGLRGPQIGEQIHVARVDAVRAAQAGLDMAGLQLSAT